MPDRPEKILLLDISSIVYRGYFALPNFTSSSGEPTGALYGLVAVLLKVLSERSPDYVIAAADAPGKTFRHETYEAYKATRPETPEDLAVQLVRAKELLAALGVPVAEAERFEADDVIATLVTKITEHKPDATIEILSNDADMLQLVGERVTVLWPKKGVSDIQELTPPKVEEKLGVPPNLVPAFKALCGDSSDNIPGIRGIGKKTAATLLAQAPSLEELLAQAAEPPDDAPRSLKRFAPTLLKEKETLEKTRELVTLATDAPVTLSLEEAKKENRLPPAFIAMLKRLGFESLLSRAKSYEEDTGEAEGQGKSEGESFEDFIKSQETQVLKEIDEAEQAGLFSKEIAEVERSLVSIISAMERRGICVDRSELKRLKTRFQKRKEELEQKIFSLAGEEFNLASPKQLADVLFTKLSIPAKKKTAGGKRSTAAAVLEELKGTHPIIEQVLSWRETQKLLTTYINALPGLVSQDGRIHAKFWQLGTATGRIASSDPNLQNIPARGGVRNVFVAPEGKVLLAADYEQIELRVAAVLAQDPVMQEVFHKGGDIHAATAARLFNVPEEEVDKTMRTNAKVINFGILYGMGPRRISKEMGVSQGEAQQFLDAYFVTFAKLKQWIEEIKEEVKRTGVTRTAFGRARIFAVDARDPRTIAQIERAAVNAPIQGTAADIMKKGMGALAEAVPEAVMLVQVHDEVLCEIEKEKLSKVAPKVREALENMWPEAPLAFPVHMKAGPSWGSLENIA